MDDVLRRLPHSSTTKEGDYQRWVILEEVKQCAKKLSVVSKFVKKLVYETEARLKFLFS